MRTVVNITSFQEPAPFCERTRVYPGASLIACSENLLVSRDPQGPETRFYLTGNLGGVSLTLNQGLVFLYFFFPPNYIVLVVCFQIVKSGNYLQVVEIIKGWHNAQKLYKLK